MEAAFLVALMLGALLVVYCVWGVVSGEIDNPWARRAVIVGALALAVWVAAQAWSGGYTVMDWMVVFFATSGLLSGLGLGSVVIAFLPWDPRKGGNRLAAVVLGTLILLTVGWIKGVGRALNLSWPSLSDQHLGELYGMTLFVSALLSIPLIGDRLRKR